MYVRVYLAYKKEEALQKCLSIPSECGIFAHREYIQREIYK